MNERIKALGRQAGFAFIDDGVYGQRWYSSKCGIDMSELEKFAELLIKDQQRTWVGLTDEEIKEIWLTGIDRGDDWLDVQGIARAIEAKLKEKNT